MFSSLSKFLNSNFLEHTVPQMSYYIPTLICITQNLNKLLTHICAIKNFLILKFDNIVSICVCNRDNKELDDFIDNYDIDIQKKETIYYSQIN